MKAKKHKKGKGPFRFPLERLSDEPTKFTDKDVLEVYAFLGRLKRFAEYSRKSALKSKVVVGSP